jgi:hypothetical protein
MMTRYYTMNLKETLFTQNETLFTQKLGDVPFELSTLHAIIEKAR